MNRLVVAFAAGAVASLIVCEALGFSHVMGWM
jgi:hypothetical protein